MNITEDAIRSALQKLGANLQKADREFDEWVNTGDDFAEPSWLIETCFLQILAIAESMELEEFRKIVISEYSRVKRSKDGFVEATQTPDGDPWSVCLSTLRRYKRALDSFFIGENERQITKELLEIIRDIHYVIGDSNIYGTKPANETDVHIRIEGLLKCFFSDLKHKPTLTKAIKNFEPDTGIPSIQTLIEYKFLDRKEQLGPFADEVLADTRGYTSKEWSRFLYVIYETSRFKTEKEWNHLLRQSGVPENATLIVLSGEGAPKRLKQKTNKT